MTGIDVVSSTGAQSVTLEAPVTSKQLHVSFRFRSPRQPITPMLLAGQEHIEDLELAQRAASDPEALALLYQRYAESIYRYCYRLLRNREAAEDATQVVFERAISAIRRYESRSSLRAWLFPIAHNEVIDQTRRRRPTADAAMLDFLVDPDPDPETLAISRDERDGLRRLIAQLADGDQQLIELRISGLNDREIADVLGISHAAVRTRQHRALVRLRALLSNQGTLS